MQFYMARQPILNRQKRVVAYELLFRDSQKNCFPDGVNSQVATAKLLINSYLNMDFEDLTEGKPALVNFPTNLLSEHLVHVVPYKNIIIEVLETVEPNDENFAVVRKLFHLGYYLALDDFIYHPKWDRFLPFFKLIKIDIIATPLMSIAHLLPLFRKYKAKLLAEKVETPEDFLLAKSLGFDYFQGYFFYKPEIIEGNDIDVAQHFLMSIYHEVMKPDFSYRRLENYFSQDLDLTYKLLKFVNSSVFSNVKEFTSIKQAMVFLGEQQLRKFVGLIVIAEFNHNKPAILIQNTMIIAKLCEVMAKLMGFNSLVDSAFLTGLLSTLDAILDKPMARAIDPLPISAEIKHALLDQEGDLSDCLKFAIAYMDGDWDRVNHFVKTYRIDSATLIRRCDGVYLWLSHYQDAMTGSA